MKTLNFKAVAVMAIAVLCAGSVNAQNEIVNEDSTAVETQVINQKGQTTRPARVKKVVKVTRRIKTIKKTVAGADSVVFRNGTSEVYADSAISDMSDETLEAIYEGKVRVYNTFNRKYDDTPRRNVYAAPVGGCLDFSDIAPLFGGKVGWETKHVDVSFSALFTSGKLPATAAEAGRFNGQYFLASLAWKAIRTKNTYFWAGPKVMAGYGSHQSNSESVDNSRNEGVTYGAGVECRYRINNYLSIGAEAGALNKVYVEPATNGTEWQKMDNFKPYALVSFGVNLFQR